MRLIDADKFKGKVIASHTGSGVIKLIAIDEVPTAYDPDKIVEQLEDYGNEETRYYKNTPYEKCIEECIGKAIEIVKGGGVGCQTNKLKKLCLLDRKSVV